MFDLVRPCARCPFRIEPRFYLALHRAVEIETNLRSGGPFFCHQTVDLGWDVDGRDHYDTVGTEQFCAGALQIIDAEEIPNGFVQMATRLGWRDPDKLAGDVEVYPTLDEFVRAMRVCP